MYMYLVGKILQIIDGFDNVIIIIHYYNRQRAHKYLLLLLTISVLI